MKKESSPSARLNESFLSKDQRPLSSQRKKLRPIDPRRREDRSFDPWIQRIQGALESKDSKDQLLLKVVKKEKVSRIGVSLEPNLLKKFDLMIGQMYYKNRSEAIRGAIREYIIKNELKSGKGKQIAALSLIYDHHKRNVTEVLTELQHLYYSIVQTNLHFHIDKHTCMELIILKGDAEKITEIKNKLTSVSGVKKSDLLITTKMDY